MASFHLLQGEALVRRLSAGIDPEIFPAWNNHPLFGNFTRALYRHVPKLSARYRQCSFAVIDDDEHLLVIVPCTASDDGLSHYGLPIVPAIAQGLAPKAEKRTIAFTLDRIEALSRLCPAPKALILGRNTDDRPDPLEDACLARLARPAVRMSAMTELSQGQGQGQGQTEAALHRHLRKSFRSLVNWGREHLIMSYINADNPDRDGFDAYTAFHQRISGGQCYPKAYWDVLWAEIIAGRGELSLGRLADGPAPVCATFTVLAGTTAYYASGVYDRDLFDKPLAHFPVFDAMIRAAQRGAKTYDLGEIIARGTDAPDKDTQIGFFKKGFVERCRLTLTWTLHGAPPKGA